jgi:hypothetical protein
VDAQTCRLARILYFTRILGTPIDGDAYAEWLTCHPDHEAPDAQLAAVFSPPHLTSSSTGDEGSGPSWQRNAPRAELFVAKKGHPQDQAAQGASGEEPAYPSKFAELIQCIQEGRPVPGVREIPNTLVRDSVRSRKLLILWKKSRKLPWPNRFEF